MVNFLDNELVSHNFHPVFVKSKPGRLYFTSLRLCYVYDGDSTFSIIIKWSEFQKQFATPDNNPKVMLKIETLEEGGTTGKYVFVFQGQNALRDRNKLKNEISQLKANRELQNLQESGSKEKEKFMPSIPKPKKEMIEKEEDNQKDKKEIEDRFKGLAPFKEKEVNLVNDIELKLRASTLAKIPKLARLHKELVLKGLMKEEEFWATRKVLLKSRYTQLTMPKAQSSGMLDIKPAGQDGNEIKYTITPEIIRNIFIQYPSVEKAYDENVPDKVSESDFWVRFFSSKYFHRNRLESRVNTYTKTEDDIFDTLLEQDDQEAKSLVNHYEDMKSGITDQLSLVKNDNDHEQSGNRPNLTMRPGRSKDTLALIRRFNYHSDQVLKKARCENGLEIKRIEEEDLILEDLKNDCKADLIPLDVIDLAGMLPNSKNSANGEKRDKGKHKRKSIKFRYTQVDLSKVQEVGTTSYTDTAKLLLSQAKESHRHQHQVPLATRLVSPPLLNKLKVYHANLTELLRHYWLAQPVAADSDEIKQRKEQKQKRMIKAMLEVREKLIKVIKEANQGVEVRVAKELIRSTLEQVRLIISNDGNYARNRADKGKN